MGRIGKWIGILGIALCLSAAFGSLQHGTEACAADDRIPEKGGELAAGTYTLTEDVTVRDTLKINGDVTIDLNGHSLSMTVGRSGSVLSVMGGTLLLKSETEQGEIKNGDDKTGGGICVGGTLKLSGNVVIENNRGSNLYLTNNNKIVLEGFTGRAGITMATPGDFTDDDPEGGSFFSDDKSYSVEGKRLKKAPLRSITAEFSAEKRIFPTTRLEELKEELSVTGLNENGVPYIGSMNLSLEIVTPEEGDAGLTLGENTIRVTATGEESETAETTFKVNVISPALRALYTDFKQVSSVYFDTPLKDLVPELTVTGTFEDGRTRTLLHEDEEGEYEESYITERYALSGDLNDREGDLATVTVSVGEIAKSFSVEISRRAISAEKLSVKENVTILEGDYPAENAFTGGLPEGVTAQVTLDKKPLMEVAATLPAGFYTVEISFFADENNYEPITETRQVTLTVNRASFLFADGELRVIFTREGGFSPDWEFECEKGEANPKLEDGADVRATYRFILRQKDEIVTDAGDVTVGLLLPENLRGKELSLYRVLENGDVLSLSCETSEEYLLFHASSFTFTEYVIATNGNFPVYLILTILFGALCIAGAGVLIWYFVVKRKMKIKE